METLKFKTSINCGNCVRLVSPNLNGDESITEWKVDTDNPDKILTVTGDHLDAAHVEALVKDAGYEIELIQ